MIGTLPRTKLLLVGNSVVRGEFQTKSEIGHHYGISVSDDGVVTFNGKPRLPKYVMDPDKCMIVGNHFKSKADVIRDWCACYMRLPAGHKIYRYMA
jgi:hypothetical protein